MGANAKLIKIALTDRGSHYETPWARDLGPAGGRKGARMVRLENVPFLHAKPTWGDVIVVAPDADGVLTWDSGLILEDGGRWTMIVDYDPHPETAGITAYRALANACREHDIVCEGLFGPKADEPGRAYLAVNGKVRAATVIGALRDEALPCELIQIHPAPPKRTKRAVKRLPRALANRTLRARRR